MKNEKTELEVPEPSAVPKVDVISPEAAKKALKTLNLSMSTMDKIYAKRVLGAFIAQPGVGPVLMEHNYHTLHHVEEAQKLGLKLARKKKATEREKLGGLSIVISAARASKCLVDNALAIAKECGVSTEKPQVIKNQPPSFGSKAPQVTVQVVAKEANVNVPPVDAQGSAKQLA